MTKPARTTTVGSRPVLAPMPAVCRAGAAAGKIHEPPMPTSRRGVVSAGHPPANPRTANPTREYQSGSGPTHHHDPARRPRTARPPPTTARTPNHPDPNHAPGTIHTAHTRHPATGELA